MRDHHDVNELMFRLDLILKLSLEENLNIKVNTKSNRLFRKTYANDEEIAVAKDSYSILLIEIELAKNENRIYTKNFFFFVFYFFL